MSLNESYSDQLDSENNYALSEDEQNIGKKHHLSRSPQKFKSIPEPLQTAHSLGQSWNSKGQPISCSILNNIRHRNSSPHCIAKETGNKIMPFNLNKSLPFEASSQKSNTNSTKARHATVPNRIHSQQATRYKSVSRIMPSTFGNRPRKGLKQDVPPAPKQATPYATQRLLSARKLRIDDLRNQIIDLQRQLEESRKENRFIKKLHDRQQKELKKIEKTRGEIPDMEKSHDEELRIIKAMNRKLQDKIKDLEMRGKSKDESFHKVTNALQNAKSTIERNKLAEIENEKKLKSLNIKLTKNEEILQALNKQVETLTQELFSENVKHEETKAAFEKLKRKQLKKGDADSNDQSVSVVKVDIPNLALTLNPTNEKRQSDLLPFREERLMSDISSSSVKEHNGKIEFSALKRQQHEFLSNRRKEFPTMEPPWDKELKKEKDSLSTERHQSHLLPTRKKEFSALKNRSNRESRRQKESVSLPSTLTRGWTKMDPSYMMASPEVIFSSRLQNLRLDDTPLTMSTPTEWREEEEFSVFMKEHERHSSTTYLDDCPTTKPLPTTSKKRK